MMIRSLMSAAALSVAMFASGAIAQTSINGAEISAEDLPKVQAQCESLAAEATKAEGAGTDDKSQGEEATKEPDTPAEIDQGTTKIDLATLTLDACKTAGFVK